MGRHKLRLLNSCAINSSFVSKGGRSHALENQKDVSACLPCPAKFYCPEGDDLQHPCPRGFYCLEGQTSGFQHPCPAGNGMWRRVPSRNQGRNPTNICEMTFLMLRAYVTKISHLCLCLHANNCLHRDLGGTCQSYSRFFYTEKKRAKNKKKQETGDTLLW